MPERDAPVCDDPQEGRFAKARFPEYWEKRLSGQKSWSDIVVQEADGVETGWCWWRWTPEPLPFVVRPPAMPGREVPRHGWRVPLGGWGRATDLIPRCGTATAHGCRPYEASRQSNDPQGMDHPLQGSCGRIVRHMCSVGNRQALSVQ